MRKQGKVLALFALLALAVLNDCGTFTATLNNGCRTACPSSAPCVSATQIVTTTVGSCSPSASPAEYIALGDSVTVGMGSTACPPIICLPATSPTYAGISNPAPTTPANGGYAQTFAVQLARARAPTAFTFDALGVSDALTGDAPLPEYNGDILTNPAQVPALASIIANRAQGGKNKLLITLWIGSNDALDATGTMQCLASGQTPTGGGIALLQPCGASGTTLADSSGNVRKGSFYAGYKAVLTKIAAIAPDAFIVINVADLSRLPLFATASASIQALQAQNAVTADAAIQAALADVNVPNEAFLDIYQYFAANPQYYAPTYFASDGFHPNDEGYAIIEQKLYATYTAAFPNF
jgi:lysophospholipase L1-like esterase